MPAPTVAVRSAVALPFPLALPRIYLDMDGVMADFDRHMLEKNLSGAELKMIAGAYRALPPYEGAIEGIRHLEDMGFEVYIATKIPGDNPAAASEKIYWLQEHVPSLMKKVIITPDKGCIGGERDYLVDDRPHKANVENFRGTVVHFGPKGAIKDWASLRAFFVEVRKRFDLEQALAQAAEQERRTLLATADETAAPSRTVRP